MCRGVQSLHEGQQRHLQHVVQAQGRQLKRFQAKWGAVRVKKTRQIKNLEPRFDSIETEKALGPVDTYRIHRIMAARVTTA